MPHIPIGDLLLRNASPRMPEAALEVVAACLDRKPAARPTATQLLRRVEGLLQAGLT
jgi:hypothetical protein